MKKKNRILIYPLIVTLLILTNSCKKDENKDVPTPTANYKKKVKYRLIPFVW